MFPPAPLLRPVVEVPGRACYRIFRFHPVQLSAPEYVYLSGILQRGIQGDADHKRYTLRTSLRIPLWSRQGGILDGGQLTTDPPDGFPSRCCRQSCVRGQGDVGLLGERQSRLWLEECTAQRRSRCSVVTSHAAGRCSPVRHGSRRRFYLCSPTA